MTILQQQGSRAKRAERILSVAGTDLKNKALAVICEKLMARQGEILSANARDLTAARQGGMIPALVDRLTLTAQRIEGIVEGVRQVAALPDPIGQVTKMERRPNGLVIGRRRVPLGVVGIIYEARPNVTVDAAALCLKSGNAVILRGGKEAIHSNTALVAIMQDALEEAGLPRDCVSLVADTSRESAYELMNLSEYLDVIGPQLAHYYGYLAANSLLEHLVPGYRRDVLLDVEYTRMLEQHLGFKLDHSQWNGVLDLEKWIFPEVDCGDAQSAVFLRNELLFGLPAVTNHI